MIISLWMFHCSSGILDGFAAVDESRLIGAQDNMWLVGDVVRRGFLLLKYDN